MRVPKQFNNITERVIDDLKQLLLSDNSQVSIAAASFSIYAYEALKEELEKGFDYRKIRVEEKSNGELVAKVVRIAKELGREIATSAEARKILNLKAKG